jgi:phage tail-like protein
MERQHEHILVKSGKGGVMTKYSAQPYSQFNFLIDLGTGNGPHGGFQEVSGLTKIKGLNKLTEVTLKRGVMAPAALQELLDQMRHGHQGAHRALTIAQKNEDRKTVLTWKLTRARIIKHVSGPFNAKGTDVAMEELVVAYERLEFE